MSDHRLDDLARLYQLFSRVNALEQVKTAWNAWIRSVAGELGKYCSNVGAKESEDGIPPWERLRASKDGLERLDSFRRRRIG